MSSPVQNKTTSSLLPDAATIVSNVCRAFENSDTSAISLLRGIKLILETEGRDIVDAVFSALTIDDVVHFAEYIRDDMTIETLREMRLDLHHLDLNGDNRHKLLRTVHDLENFELLDFLIEQGMNVADVDFVELELHENLNNEPLMMLEALLERGLDTARLNLSCLVSFAVETGGVKLLELGQLLDEYDLYDCIDLADAVINCNDIRVRDVIYLSSIGVDVQRLKQNEDAVYQLITNLKFTKKPSMEQLQQLREVLDVDLMQIDVSRVAEETAHVQLVALLVEAGADINTLTEEDIEGLVFRARTEADILALQQIGVDPRAVNLMNVLHKRAWATISKGGHSELHELSSVQQFKTLFEVAGARPLHSYNLMKYVLSKHGFYYDTGFIAAVVRLGADKSTLTQAVLDDFILEASVEDLRVLGIVIEDINIVRILEIVKLDDQYIPRKIEALVSQGMSPLTTEKVSQYITQTDHLDMNRVERILEVLRQVLRQESIAATRALLSTQAVDKLNKTR
jgi:hypothetical protein